MPKPPMPKPPMPKPPRHARFHRPRENGSTVARARQTGAPSADQILLHGYHAAAAALANPRRIIRRIYLTAPAAERLGAAATARGLEAQLTEPRELDRRLGADAVHQGILIEAAPLPEPALEDVCLAVAGAPVPLLLVLDQVTDPHNVGAILRSAAAFGVAGLVMTRQHSPPLSGVLAKAASGALEHVPVVLVTNLARTLERLADLEVFTIGLDGDAPARLEEQAGDRPTALVLGAEGRGLRRLTREGCAVLCHITTFGALRSLNVSNAAAVALHALRTRG